MKSPRSGPSDKSGRDLAIPGVAEDEADNDEQAHEVFLWMLMRDTNLLAACMSMTMLPDPVSKIS
jgi:hypothetical protein